MITFSGARRCEGLDKADRPLQPVQLALYNWRNDEAVTKREIEKEEKKTWIRLSVSAPPPCCVYLLALLARRKIGQVFTAREDAGPCRKSQFCPERNAEVDHRLSNACWLPHPCSSTWTTGRGPGKSSPSNYLCRAASVPQRLFHARFLPCTPLRLTLALALSLSLSFSLSLSLSLYQRTLPRVTLSFTS
jgi:hypothetical protein